MTLGPEDFCNQTFHKSYILQSCASIAKEGNGRPKEALTENHSSRSDRGDLEAAVMKAENIGKTAAAGLTMILGDEEMEL